jgi:lactate dehydrogenase-like 2-hydroxyacid dehydrogenase
MHAFNSRVIQENEKTVPSLSYTSRGPIICESDLIDALLNGEIAGAGLDVP